MSCGVVGMGIVSSLGENKRRFSQALKDGESGITYLSDKKYAGLSVKIGAEIKKFSFIDRLQTYDGLAADVLDRARRCAQRSPFAIQTSVLSALEAWQEAGLRDRAMPPDRIGLIVAGENTTRSYQYELQARFEKTPEYLSPKYAVQYLDTNQVGVLSEILNIRGEGLVVGGASASGNVGIIKGMQLIQAGVVDACLVVGVVADLSPMEMQGFINIGAMGGKTSYDRPEKASRPFDAQHDGFIYGQASASVVLESVESAHRRDVPMQARILGGAINLHATSTSEPDVDGEACAMNTALVRGGITASDVDYLNAHGSSSPLGDDVEAKAINDVYKGHLSNLWINSTKGLTGHCLYSAGVVELISSIVQMQGGFIHPNKNLDSPIDKNLRFSGRTFVNEKTSTAMSNSFGFGGINSSLVFQCLG